MILQIPWRDEHSLSGKCMKRAIGATPPLGHSTTCSKQRPAKSQTQEVDGDDNQKEPNTGLKLTISPDCLPCEEYSVTILRDCKPTSADLHGTSQRMRTLICANKDGPELSRR